MTETYLPYLLVLLLLAVLGAGLVLLRRRAGQGSSPGAGRGRSAQGEELDTVASWEPVATRALNAAEREAYHTLRRALPEHIVLAQVPLARFIKVPTRNSYAEWMRRVGAMSADLVVCNAQAEVVAVVEIRNPISRDKERAQRRQARMDRVLEAAKIPVHVWLEGALPGPAVARETILGGSVVFTTKSGATLVDTAARGQATGLEGLAVHEDDRVDLDLGAGGDGDPSRPISQWFESGQTEPSPLGPR